MTKQYKIRDGFSFIDQQSGKVVAGEITLADDVAALHLHKLEPVQTSAQRKVAKQAADAVKVVETEQPTETPAPAIESTPPVDSDASKAE